MNEQNLKQEFIKYFGIDKWNEEEMLKTLYTVEEHICKILGINPIPVIYEENIFEDSKIYIKEEYIGINVKYNQSFIESLKCLTHELRHVYQIMVVSLNIKEEPLLNEWKKDLKQNIRIININDTKNIEKQMYLPIEIDAYAFTKCYIKKYYKKDIIHPSKAYEKIIKLYINKYLSEF